MFFLGGGGGGVWLDDVIDCVCVVCVCVCSL